MKKAFIIIAIASLAIGYFSMSSNTPKCNAGGGSLDCIHCTSNCCDGDGNCTECP